MALIMANDNGKVKWWNMYRLELFKNSYLNGILAQCLSILASVPRASHLSSDFRLVFESVLYMVDHHPDIIHNH